MSLWKNLSLHMLGLYQMWAGDWEPVGSGEAEGKVRLETSVGGRENRSDVESESRGRTETGWGRAWDKERRSGQDG